MMRKIYICAIVIITLTLPLFSNNLTISNLSLTDINANDNYVMVQFDISWDNSWRTDNLNGDGVTNWDAAWLFVKYKKASDGLWYHATFNATAGNHNTGSQSTNATIDSRSDGKGVLFYRSGNGTGTFNSSGVKLRWQYGTDGLNDDLDTDVSEIKIFCIEMVYVPQGSFYLGSGGDEYHAFYKYPTTTNAYQVTSEGAINTGQTADYLWASANGFIEEGTIPADFPKGYNDLYFMKYEITQEQYVDFLNTLTRTQQNTRTETDISGTSITNRYVMSNSTTISNRNGIRCDVTIPASPTPVTFYCDYNGNGAGNESDDGQNIACNWLSWADGCAYSDWAGLRPMTELEFEKACRGTANPVANESAWGNTTIQAATEISNSGTSSEVPSNSEANCICSNNANVQGPMRVGSCTSGSRSSMGSSYYGIMEMSGNLWEELVTIGNATGRSFTGINGNGSLGASGDADASNWPNSVGLGLRGGGYDGHPDHYRVSDRSVGSWPNAVRSYNIGFRGVSSIP